MFWVYSFGLWLVRNLEDKPKRIVKNGIILLKNNGIDEVISEKYFYKTDAYYTILKFEHDGKNIVPKSDEVLDAYIVPICLTKAKHAGIPTCDWEVSYSYVPLPSIIYGLNYFSDPSNYFIVNDQDYAKKIINQVTHNGKYLFCYQKIAEDSVLITCNSIFGRTSHLDKKIKSLSKKIFETFKIPLVSIVFVKNEENYCLSSLCPTKYSGLREEKEILQEYIKEGGYE